MSPLCFGSDRSCCCSLFQKRQWNQCMQAIKRNAPDYCLTQGCYGPMCSAWWWWLLHQSALWVFISWADSGLAPLHCLWLSMSYFWHSQFLSKPFVSAGLPPVPVLGNHHKSDCISPSGREPHHSPLSVIYCALQFLISPSVTIVQWASLNSDNNNKVHGGP